MGEIVALVPVHIEVGRAASLDRARTAALHHPTRAWAPGLAAVLGLVLVYIELAGSACSRVALSALHHCIRTLVPGRPATSGLVSASSVVRICGLRAVDGLTAKWPHSDNSWQVPACVDTVCFDEVTASLVWIGEWTWPCQDQLA